MGAEFDSQITFCYTDDLEGTARFYEEVLELPMILDQGGCRIYRTSKGSFLGFCERAGQCVTEGVVLTLVTGDVDGWYEKLSSRGVHFDTTPAFNPQYNIYHCFLRDPNGYRIEIQRFEDPRWKY